MMWGAGAVWKPGGGLDAPLFRGGDLLERGEREQGELDTRPGAAVALDHLGQIAIERRRNEPYAEAQAAGFVQAARYRLRLFDALQHLRGLLVGQPAPVGEADRSAASLDQSNAEFVLELLDLPAERRLRDTQHSAARVKFRSRATATK
jgi:hypothetical protein